MKKFVASILVASLVWSEPALAQTRDRNGQAINDVIPANNDDLTAISARAKEILATTANCDNYLCPVIDCERAFELLQSLYTAERILEETLKALNEAEAAANAHHKSLVGQGGITTANLLNIQGAIILHKYLHDTGSAILDITSVVNFLSGVKDLPNAPGLKQLSEIYEVLKDAESLFNTLLQNLGLLEDSVTPVGNALVEVISLAEAAGLIQPGENLENLKANINDIVSQLTDSINTVKELIDIYKAGGVGVAEKWANVRFALGQMLGRIAKAYSNKVLEQRRDRLRQTANALVAEGGVTATAYNESLRIAERQFAAEEALQSVRAARLALAACVARWCGSTSLSRPVIPSFIQTYQDRTQSISFYSWGQALTWLNPRIPVAGEALQGTFAITEGDCRSDTIIGSPGTAPTNCPACIDRARAYRLELEEYDSLLRMRPEDRPANYQELLAQNRDDVHETLAKLRECERLQCPPSKPVAKDYGQVIASYPRIDRELLVDTDCDPCQPIADQMNETQAELQFYLRELARLQEEGRLKTELYNQRVRLNREADGINQQLRSQRGRGGEGRVDRAVLQSELLDITARIRRLNAEIKRLDESLKTFPFVQQRIEQLRERIQELRYYLRECEDQNCKPPTTFIGLHDVKPVTPEGDIFTTPGIERELTPSTGAQPVPSADLTLDKNASSPQASPGAMIFYDLTGTNLGPDRADNVTVTDTLPAGLTFRDATTSIGTCFGSGANVRCDVGGLAMTEKVTIRVGVDITQFATGSLTNNATIDSTTLDPNRANNIGSSNVMIAVTTPVDLSVTKSASPTTVDAGGTVGYTITVRNNGSANATDVRVTDSVPSGTTVQNTSSSQGTCLQSGAEVRCDVGTLAGGATATVTVNATTQQNASGTITNTAQVTGAQSDPSTANNTATATITVRPPAPVQADLGVTKSALSQTAQPGGSVSYSLNVTNAGPANASGVRLTDTVPPGLTFGSSNPSQGTCAGSGSQVQCDLGGINAGQGAAIRLDFNVDQNASGTVTNTANVTGNESDPASSNNSASSTVTIQRPACALGIFPGLYFSTGGNCGAQGDVDASCMSMAEIILRNPTLNLTCDQNGNCGDNNIILGAPNHRCMVMRDGAGFSVFCQRLSNGQPVAECRQTFQPR